LWGRGARDEAIAQFRKAVELKGDSTEAHNNLGVALVQAGRLDEAITNFRMVLQLNPDSAEARNNLGVALVQAGRFAEAIPHFQKVLAANPDNLAVLNHTAWVLATCRDASVRNGAEAVKLAERAVQLSRAQEPAFLDTLAAAYAEAGRFSEAVETARRGLALAAQQNNQPLAEALKARVALYESKAPFRETR
jgi:Flp pilus assembly protein TadD